MTQRQVKDILINHLKTKQLVTYSKQQHSDRCVGHKVCLLVFDIARL